jgi:hypothetical protein
VPGRKVTVKKTSALNRVFVQGGGNFIDGDTTVELSSGNMGVVDVVSDGNQWYITSLSGNAAESTVLYSSNLIGHWKLDEEPGVTMALDSGPNGFHGTYINGAELGAGNVGVFGRSWAGDGSDDQIKVESGGNYDGQSFSMMCWVKLRQLPSVSGSDIQLIRKRNSGENNGYVLRLQSSTGDLRGSFLGATMVDNYTSDSEYVAGSGNVTEIGVGVWFHCAGTYDGSFLRTYLNGNLHFKDDSSGTMSSNATASLTFSRTDSKTVKGELDDIRIYSRAISSDEIKTLAQEGQYRY